MYELLAKPNTYLNLKPYPLSFVYRSLLVM